MRLKSEVHGISTVFVTSVRRERDRRNVDALRLREPTDATDKRVAILTRHPDVQHEQIRAELGNRDVNRGAGLHGSYSRACSLEQARDGLEWPVGTIDTKTISAEFAKGNMAFVSPYLADDIQWNILGEDPIVGKDQVLEVSKMLQLESFPVITLKNVISEGNLVVVESTGKATTKEGKPYNQSYCDIFRFVGEQLQEVTTYLDTALNRNQ